MDNRFRVGDYVVVHKPEDIDEFPLWECEMADCEGAVAQIRNIWDHRGETAVALEGRDSCSVNGWFFNIRWLEPLKTFESANLEQLLKGGL